MKRLTMGLSPAQCAIVLGVFAFTLIGAIAVAFAMRRWNARRA
jgi:hypothetical protein